MYAYLLFVVFLADGIKTQVPFYGECPDVKDVQKDFDIKRYLGTWISVEKYYAAVESGKKCFESVYSLSDNGTILIKNRMIGKISPDEAMKYCEISTKKNDSLRPIYKEGYAIPTGEPNEAKFLFHFKYRLPKKGIYQILETDYDSYSVMWSCAQRKGFNNRLAWILTRNRNYTEEVLNKAYAVLDRNNISRRPLIQMDQTNCPSYE